MGERKEYTSANARIPVLTERLNDVVKKHGGVSRVSDLTGISRNTITFWCQGARTPDAANLITLSKTLNISVDYILGLRNSPTVNEAKQAAEEYTGLSPEAVEKIHEYCPLPQSLTSIKLSEVLASDCFYESFMDAIIDAWAASVSHKHLPSPSSNMSYAELSEIYKNLDLTMLHLDVGAFKASQSALTLLESLYHVSETTKEVKSKMIEAQKACDELEVDNDGEYEADGD